MVFGQPTENWRGRWYHQYSGYIMHKESLNVYLVGGLEHGFYFPIQSGMS